MKCRPLGLRICILRRRGESDSGKVVEVLVVSKVVTRNFSALRIRFYSWRYSRSDVYVVVVLESSSTSLYAVVRWD
jgi:hypothetical protein